MAQTTAAISAKDMYVALGTNGIAYTDLSGLGASVEVSGGERDSTGTKTFDGDTPILTIGKRNLITVTIRFVYTETAGDAYALARDAYEDGTVLYARWSPKGDDQTEFRYSTAAGYVKNPVYPGGAADSADPVMIEVVLETTSITEATVP